MYARGMDLECFYAMRQGEATQIDGLPARLSVVPLGELRVPSGLLEASDPFMALGDGPVFELEPGSYQTFVTVADISPEQDGSHTREAYLSLIVAEGIVATVEAASSVRGAPARDEYWGVGVDTGTVAFSDHEAVQRCMPLETPDAPWYQTVFGHEGPDSWFALMDSPEHIRAGVANIVMPLATDGENIVLSHSGWGDGFYPVLVAKDSAGKILAFHIDLLVVGEPVEEDEEDIPLVDGSLLKDDGSVEAPPDHASIGGAALGAESADDGTAWDGYVPDAGPHVEDGQQGAEDAGAWQLDGSGGPVDEGISAFGFGEEQAPPKKVGFFARLLGFFRWN